MPSWVRPEAPHIHCAPSDDGIFFMHCSSIQGCWVWHEVGDISAHCFQYVPRDLVAESFWSLPQPAQATCLHCLWWQEKPETCLCSVKFYPLHTSNWSFAIFNYSLLACGMMGLGEQQLCIPLVHCLHNFLQPPPLNTTHHQPAISSTGSSVTAFLASHHKEQAARPNFRPKKKPD